MGLKEVFVLPVARHWIAGTDMESAIKDAKAANSKGIGAVVNFLGEEITDVTTVDAHQAEYLKLQKALAGSGVNGFASVKLTQLGLSISEEDARRRLGTVAANASGLGQLLWIDMEGSQFTQSTISIYLDALASYRGVGLVLQAYLRRSEEDIKTLLEHGGKMRLVKGAYREQPDVVFTTRESIQENFRKLMGRLFDQADGFAIATHDSSLIEDAKKLADSKHTKFRFEMLKGIRDDLKAELVSSGYTVFEYLPYGGSWYAYSKRRLTEHPSNIWLLLRSLV